MLPQASYAVFVEHDDLSGLDIPDHRRADRVKRTAFRGDDVFSVTRLSVAQRAEAVLIPHGDQLLRGHKNQ